MIDKKNKLIFSVLCLMIIVPQMGLSLYVPALAAIKHFYLAGHAQIALTMTSYLYGYAFSFLFMGTLADFFGKKQVAIFSIVVFILAGCFIMFANSIGWFIVWRFFQGVSGGGCAVSARSLARDLFSGRRLSQAMSSLSIAFVLAQGFSLLVGGWLITFFQWQSSFLVMMLVSVIILLSSIAFLPTLNKKTISITKSDKLLKQAVGAYRNLLNSKTYLRFAFIAALGYGVVISFNILAPFWAKHQLGISPHQFGFLGFMVSLSYLAGALLNKYLITEKRIHYFLVLGIVLLLLSGLIMLVLSLCWPQNLFSFSPLFLSMLALAFIYPNAMVQALECTDVGSGAGVAGVGCIQQACGGVVSLLAGFLLSYDDTLLWLALSVVLIGSLLVFFLISILKNQFYSTS